MRNVIIQAVCFFAALMASVSCTVENEKVISADSEKDKVAIERLIDQYIETINRCDTALVNAIWSHDAKVSFIGPSGYYSTYEEIRDSLVVGGFYSISPSATCGRIN